MGSESLKIGTHDAATGERGEGFLSWLVTPFARTQRKTLREQYNAGCRCFDLRVRKKGDRWVMAHGLWHTKRSAENILVEMNNYPERVSVTITYEGDYTHNEELTEFVLLMKQKYTNLKYGGIACKYGKEAKGVSVKYDYIIPADTGWIDAPTKQGFLPLDGRSWHTYIPIPYLWWWIYNRKPQFTNEYYTYVDFL